MGSPDGDLPLTRRIRSVRPKKRISRHYVRKRIASGTCSRVIDEHSHELLHRILSPSMPVDSDLEFAAGEGLWTSCYGSR